MRLNAQNGFDVFRLLSQTARLVLMAGCCVCSEVLSAPVFAAPPSNSAQARENVLFLPQAQRDPLFAHSYKLFPSLLVTHSARVHALPRGPSLVPSWSHSSMTLAQYMDKYRVMGVMVLQNGRLRLVRYSRDFGPATQWASFSVAKSVTSVLLGVALERGYIHSLDDMVIDYVPELAHSAYANVTLRELLTKTTGIRWNEDYSNFLSDVAQMYVGPSDGDEPQIVTHLKKLARAWPAGTHFYYNTAESDLVGIVVQRATHRSLADWLSQTIGSHTA